LKRSTFWTKWGVSRATIACRPKYLSVNVAEAIASRGSGPTAERAAEEDFLPEGSGPESETFIIEL